MDQQGEAANLARGHLKYIHLVLYKDPYTILLLALDQSIFEEKFLPVN